MTFWVENEGRNLIPQMLNNDCAGGNYKGIKMIRIADFLRSNVFPMKGKGSAVFSLSEGRTPFLEMSSSVTLFG